MPLSRAWIPSKRDYFSQFAKQMPPLYVALPWQEFVFPCLSLFPFFLFLWPSLPHRALVSSCRQDFFFFSPVYTSSCTRRVYLRIHTSLATPQPLRTPSRLARVFVDTRRHGKRANPRTPGAAYFNQLAYVHCLLQVPVSLRYSTSRNNDRTQQHSTPPSICERAKHPWQQCCTTLERLREPCPFLASIVSFLNGYQEGWSSRIAARLLPRDIPGYSLLFMPKCFVVENSKGLSLVFLFHRVAFDWVWEMREKRVVDVRRCRFRKRKRIVVDPWLNKNQN